MEGSGSLPVLHAGVAILEANIDSYFRFCDAKMVSYLEQEIATQSLLSDPRVVAANPWWQTAGALPIDRAGLLPVDPFPLEPGTVHLVYGPPGVGVSTRLLATGEQGITVGRAFVYVPTQVAAASTGQAIADCVIDAATRFENPVVAIDGAPGSDWAASLKRAIDTSALDAITIVVAGGSASGLREAAQALTGRRGGGVMSRMLPMSFREMVRHVSPVASSAIDRQDHDPTDLAGWARGLAPVADDLRRVWSTWCGVGSLPGTVARLRASIEDGAFLPSVDAHNPLVALAAGQAISGSVKSVTAAVELLSRLSAPSRRIHAVAR